MCPLTLVPLFYIVSLAREISFPEIDAKSFSYQPNMFIYFIFALGVSDSKFCQLRNALDILFLDGGGFLRAGCLLVLPNTTMLQYRQKREKSDVIMNIVHASYIVSCHFLTVVRNVRHYMFLTEMKN